MPVASFQEWSPVLVIAFSPDAFVLIIGFHYPVFCVDSYVVIVHLLHSCSIHFNIATEKL